MSESKKVDHSGTMTALMVAMGGLAAFTSVIMGFYVLAGFVLLLTLTIVPAFDRVKKAELKKEALEALSTEPVAPMPAPHPKDVKIELEREKREVEEKEYLQALKYYRKVQSDNDALFKDREKFTKENLHGVSSMFPDLQSPRPPKPPRMPKAPVPSGAPERVSAYLKAQPSTSDEAAVRAGLWRQARERHEAVASAWAPIVSDPLSALEHSTLLDVAQPRTAAFIETYGRLTDLFALLGDDCPTSRETLDEYAQLSRDAEARWHEALLHAERSRYDWLPEADRNRARKAAGLLATAADDASPMGLRAQAARKAAELLTAIETVQVPKATMMALASSHRALLASGD